MVQNVTTGYPSLPPLPRATRPTAGERNETQPRRAEADARQILARLLGDVTGEPLPVRKATSDPAKSEDFAPHLGRYLDVTA